MSDQVDIIFFALPRWDASYSSTAYSLAKEFSKNNRVFYIDNPITLKYFITHLNSPEIKRRMSVLLFGRSPYREISSSPKGSLIAVTPPLTLSINFLPKGLLYNKLSSINDTILFRTIRNLLKDHAITNYIFINSFNPFYLRKFTSSFKPNLSIYHVVDDIRHSVHVNKHGPELEDELISNADLVITTSRQLERLKSSISKNIFTLPNAADITLFKRSLNNNIPKPVELLAIDKPIIIYTGHIDSRIDYEILEESLIRHSDKVFLMVGPVSRNNKQIDRLVGYGNIVLTGKKDLSDLPSYLHYAQCAIIPFKCNTLTSSIYPLKINEYLAAGKPVVSTPFSEDIMDFKNVIEIGDGCSAFSDCISIAMNDSPEKLQMRTSLAESNSWTSRVSTFWKYVDNLKK